MAAIGGVERDRGARRFVESPVRDRVIREDRGRVTCDRVACRIPCALAIEERAGVGVASLVAAGVEAGKVVQRVGELAGDAHDHQGAPGEADERASDRHERSLHPAAQGSAGSVVEIWITSMSLAGTFFKHWSK